MTTNNIPFKTGQSASPDENQKVIDNHKKAAKHLEEAALYHHEAAKHHEAKNYAKALEFTLKAKGCYTFANEHQKEVGIYHALHN